MAINDYLIILRKHTKSIQNYNGKTERCYKQDCFPNHMENKNYHLNTIF